MTNDAEMDSDVRRRRNMKHQLDSPFSCLSFCYLYVSSMTSTYLLLAARSHCVLSIPDDTQNLHVSLTTCEDFPEMTNDAEMDSDVRQRRNMKHQLDSPFSCLSFCYLYVSSMTSTYLLLAAWSHCVLSIPDDTQNLHVSLTTCEDFPEMTNDAEMDSDVRQRRNMKHQLDSPFSCLSFCYLYVSSMTSTYLLLAAWSHCVLSIPDDTQNLHVSLTTCEDFPEMTNDAEMDSDVRRRRNMKHQLDSPFSCLSFCYLYVSSMTSTNLLLAAWSHCVLSIPHDTQNLHVSLTTCEDFPEMTNDAEMDSDVRRRRNMKHQLDSPFLQLPFILLLVCQQHDIDISLACCMVPLCLIHPWWHSEFARQSDNLWRLSWNDERCWDGQWCETEKEHEAPVGLSFQLPFVLLLVCQQHDIDISLACCVVPLCLIHPWWHSEFARQSDNLWRLSWNDERCWDGQWCETEKEHEAPVGLSFQLPFVLLLVCQQHDIDISLACCVVPLCLIHPWWHSEFARQSDNLWRLSWNDERCWDGQWCETEKEHEAPVGLSFQLPFVLLLVCQQHDIDISLACCVVPLCLIHPWWHSEFARQSDNLWRLSWNDERCWDGQWYETPGVSAVCSVRLPCIILYHAIECLVSVDSSSFELFSAKVVVFVSAEESSQDGAMQCYNHANLDLFCWRSWKIFQAFGRFWKILDNLRRFWLYL